MNIYLITNILIIFVYLFFLIISYKKGFIYEAVNLLFTILIFFLAWFLSPILANLFPLVKLDPPYSLLGVEPILNTAIYYAIIVLVLRVLAFFIMPLFKKLSKIPFLGSLNKILGLIIGFINASIIIMLISFLLNTPLIKNGNEIKENTLFKYIDKYSNKGITYVVDHIDFNKIKEYVSDIDIDNARQSFKDWLIEQEYLR